MLFRSFSCGTDSGRASEMRHRSVIVVEWRFRKDGTNGRLCEGIVYENVDKLPKCACSSISVNSRVLLNPRSRDWRWCNLGRKELKKSALRLGRFLGYVSPPLREKHCLFVTANCRTWSDSRGDELFERIDFIVRKKAFICAIVPRETVWYSKGVAMLWRSRDVLQSVSRSAVEE